MTASSKTRTNPRKRPQPDAVNDHDPPSPRSSSSSTRAEKGALPKTPARKITHPDGSVTIQPPANWEAVYDTIKTMRLSNPTAPVDTMGCEDLHWRAATPREQRYHTLTALMLSSQTKDTVTAAAMQRLHTELVPTVLEPPPPSSSSSTTTTTITTKPTPSTLTIPNILSAPAPHLDSLISKVGFHNTKTRHLQQTARILHDDFASDIPSTLDGLLRLPGVGPKMAYLALSAAWGVDAGIGVDVHVHRITNLWGWHSTRTPEETRAWLQAWLPRQRWHEINRLLVGLGQTVCLPVGRRCGECSLSGTGLCKGEIRGWKAKAKAKANERRVRGGQGQG
jgi:endonuclease III